MGTAATGQGETYLASFLQRLEELRWVQGRNISTNVRWWAGGPEQMRTAVAEQLAFSPDVFMVWSNLALELVASAYRRNHNPVRRRSGISDYRRSVPAGAAGIGVDVR